MTDFNYFTNVLVTKPFWNGTNNAVSSDFNLVIIHAVTVKAPFLYDPIRSFFIQL